MKKNILIINTGGTVSSIKTDRGYEPTPGFVSQILSTHTALQHKTMPNFKVLEYSPLIDSSNITVHNWNEIASSIADSYHEYDGFIILHGTDTMAYTASALSFMLENLNKPVLLTGSQIPLSEVRNDAIHNITTSLLIAAQNEVNEVCIYFNQRLLRGNRSQKISADQFSAFDSPNYPWLGQVGIDIETNKQILLTPSNKKFTLQKISPHFIANFRLFPGFASAVLENILSQPLQGLILETYGSGNAQNNDLKFLELLESACKRNIVIINCSQCHQGKVKMSQYATGFTLKQSGLLSGHDMTPEAAHCKLLYLFSKYSDLKQIKSLVEKNIRGELTTTA